MSGLSFHPPLDYTPRPPGYPVLSRRSDGRWRSRVPAEKEIKKQVRLWGRVLDYGWHSDSNHSRKGEDSGRTVSVEVSGKVWHVINTCQMNE